MVIQDWIVEMYREKREGNGQRKRKSVNEFQWAEGRSGEHDMDGYGRLSHGTKDGHGIKLSCQTRNLNSKGSQAVLITVRRRSTHR